MVNILSVATKIFYDSSLFFKFANNKILLEDSDNWDSMIKKWKFRLTTIDDLSDAILYFMEQLEDSKIFNKFNDLPKIYKDFNININHYLKDFINNNLLLIFKIKQFEPISILNLENLKSTKLSFNISLRSEEELIDEITLPDKIIIQKTIDNDYKLIDKLYNDTQDVDKFIQSFSPTKEYIEGEYFDGNIYLTSIFEFIYNVLIKLTNVIVELNTEDANKIVELASQIKNLIQQLEPGENEPIDIKEYLADQGIEDDEWNPTYQDITTEFLK